MLTLLFLLKGYYLTSKPYYAIFSLNYPPLSKDKKSWTKNSNPSP